MNQHKYTDELKQFIIDHNPGRTAQELADLVNRRFGLSLSGGAMNAYRKRKGIKSTIDGRYRPGHEPANKGTHIGGYEPTQFKKGNRPHNYLPVGTERINSDGYYEIKVADPKKWKGKHIILWEQHHGKVPKGHAVIFGDGDKNNVTIDNLVLVTRVQLVMLNKYGLIKNNADLTRVGVTVVDLKRKIREVEKP